VVYRAQDEPPATREEYWREVIDRTIAPMDIQFPGGLHERQQIVTGQVGALNIAAWESGPGEVTHTTAHARRSDPEVFHLFVTDGTRRSLVQRILTYIEDRLANPELSPAKVAEAHHISVRYLHKLFAAEDRTVAGFHSQQAIGAVPARSARSGVEGASGECDRRAPRVHRAGPLQPRLPSRLRAPAGRVPPPSHRLTRSVHRRSMTVQPAARPAAGDSPTLECMSETT
jgi:hypothetical protein